MKIFSIFDVKAKFFQRPFCDSSSAAAIRSFSIGVNEGDSVLKKFPDDFALMEIGSFNSETGQLIPLDHPLNLGSARTVYQEPQVQNSLPFASGSTNHA